MIYMYYAKFFNRLLGKYDTLEFSTDEEPYSFFWNTFDSTPSVITDIKIYALTAIRKVH